MPLSLLLLLLLLAIGVVGIVWHFRNSFIKFVTPRNDLMGMCTLYRPLTVPEPLCAWFVCVCVWITSFRLFPGRILSPAVLHNGVPISLCACVCVYVLHPYNYVHSLSGFARSLPHLLDLLKSDKFLHTYTCMWVRLRARIFLLEIVHAHALDTENTFHICCFIAIYLGLRAKLLNNS